MNKRKALALVLGVTMIIGAGCGNKKEELEEVKKPVVIRTMKKGPVNQDLEISGNIKPSQLVKMSFKVPGTIETINVEEGSNVSAGQVLMSLNRTDYETGLMAAQAKYDSVKLELDSKLYSAEEQAKVSLEFINTQLGRVTRLYEKGAVSKKSLEELELQKTIAETKYQEVLEAKVTAQSQLQQAQAMVDGESLKLGYTTMTSPINGTVIKKLFEQGEIVAQGYPTLVLGQLDTLEVEIGIPDTEIDKLKLGSQVKVYIKGLDKNVSGVITNLGETADLETRTFPVKVEIKNPEKNIKPGMIASVIISNGTKNAMITPVDSIVDTSEGKFLYVYDKGTNKVSKRKVKVGEVYGDKIEITEGIKDGEIVVIDGQYRLNDGDEVKARGEKDD